MGDHYANVVHVLQAEIANYQFPNTDGEQTIHILTHGAVNHVCNMQATEFNAWMLKSVSDVKISSSDSTLQHQVCWSDLSNSQYARRAADAIVLLMNASSLPADLAIVSPLLIAVEGGFNSQGVRRAASLISGNGVIAVPVGW